MPLKKKEVKKPPTKAKIIAGLTNLAPGDVAVVVVESEVDVDPCVQTIYVENVANSAPFATEDANLTSISAVTTMEWEVPTWILMS